MEPSSSSKIHARSASDVDSPSFAIQNLSSILNNPLAGSASSSSAWFLWPPSAADSSPPPPPAAVSSIPDVPRSSFSLYLSSISDLFSKFEDINHHSLFNDLDHQHQQQQGAALVACLKEVPSFFFKEDFSLEEGATFKLACPFSESEDENLALQERLTGYLDTVEMHLVREISLRSDSFFEAQGKLEELNGEIVEACVRIRELKEGIRVLTGGLVGPARTVMELNAAKGNLVALQQKLTVILYVSQAVSALKMVSG